MRFKLVKKKAVSSKKPVKPINSKSKNKSGIILRSFRAFVKKKILPKIKIVGENLISQELNKGPVVILSSHNFKNDYFLIEAISPKHVFAIGDPGVAIKQGTYIRGFNIPGVRELMHQLGIIEINRKKPAAGLRSAIENSVSLLEKGEAICIFPKGYGGKAGTARDQSLGESTSRSSALFILQEAEKRLGKKIPIVFVRSVDSKEGVLMKMEKGFLPEKFDRKKLALDYIDKIENL
jgi:1-acyl-sn-glycerol-3-phosphate acyltransferase